MYIIVKLVKNSNGVEMPVVLIDDHSEVWEFESEKEADSIRTILEKNSDSGHRYIVKKVGSHK